MLSSSSGTADVAAGHRDGPLHGQPAFAAASAGVTEPSLQAVLWDMDGTLVDTEPYWIQGEMELVARYGGSWSVEQAEALVGQSLYFSSTILQAAGVPLSSRQIIDELIGRVTEQVRQRIPWRPGALELLQELRTADVPCAMVTMSEQLLAREVQRQLPDNTFDFLLTGDMVTHGKPDPEPYRRALKELQRRYPQATANTVVALEDSVPGVTSAQAAGLVTVGIPHFVPLPTDIGHTPWESLEGRTVADLQGLVNQRATLARVN